MQKAKVFHMSPYFVKWFKAKKIKMQLAQVREQKMRQANTTEQSAALKRVSMSVVSTESGSDRSRRISAKINFRDFLT